MPRMINGFDQHWTKIRINEFFDNAKFIFTELCNMQDEIEAEIGFMSWAEKTSPYGEFLEAFNEKLGHASGQAEDLFYDLRDVKEFLED